MTQEQMNLLVPEKLRSLETSCGIRIVYAAESGSRACGTASPESDFDVRFIYIRRQEDYLRLERTSDVLEFPISDGWDLVGWDLSKLLRLLQNSNPQLYEWLGSPVVYIDDGFSRRLRPLLEHYYSQKTFTMHYLNQMGGRLRRALQSDPTSVKHYLYAFQYLLATRWCMERCSPPPVRLEELAVLLPEEYREDLQALLRHKISFPNQPLIPRQERLDAFLTAEKTILSHQAALIPPEAGKGWEPLNKFFLQELFRS